MSSHAERRKRRTGPLVGAVLYVGAWVVGLLIPPRAPGIDASGATIAARYAAHQGATLVQSILVHGVTAVALVLVVSGVEYSSSRNRARLSDLTLLIAGCVAAALSGVQLGFDVALATSVGPADTGQARLLFDTINRLDGAKLIALAVMSAAGFELSRRRFLPAWLGVTAVPLTVSLVIGAIGYLSRSPRLGGFAAIALVLLMIWVAGAGVVASGRDRRDS